MRAALAVIPLLAALQAGPVPVTTTELDLDPERYDGRQVVVVGELIGDYGWRADAVWVQLNDDAYASVPLAASGEQAGVNRGIGLRIPAELFDEGWGPPGRHRRQGPVVEATGTFRFHDPSRWGETFVDVEEVVLVQASRQLPAVAPVWPWLAGSTLLAIAGGLFLAARSRNRRLGIV